MAGGTEELKATIESIVSFAAVDSLAMDPWIQKLVTQSEISVDSYTKDPRIHELLHQNQTARKSRVTVLEHELRAIQAEREHALKKHRNLTKELYNWLTARGVLVNNLVTYWQ